MERMAPRRGGDENGDATTAGRAGAVRAAAATVAVVAALAGCSVTVQPKNAAATRPLTSSSPTPSATATASGTSSTAAPSTSAPSTSAATSPTATPSDVDHTVCSNVRDVLATLKSKLATDKDSDSRTGQDYRTAGTALRVQDTKTDNPDLRATLKAVGTDYQNVGRDVTNHASADDDLAKAADASKPLATLCGGGSGASSTPSGN
ncbi:hypothetical protein [Catenulispora rubra]|uniref:hypothetical protein n=1 Tax=Catenulispora rubra TaxID=280293 RepID=UPI001892158B|nr:hypothetical protein [Catenulispora rubra]